MSDLFESAFPSPPPRAGQYNILYVDPPWKFTAYDEATGLDKSPDAHYETMTVDEMAAIPLGDWGAPDSLLIMWMYDPMLPDALELAKRWGYTEWVTVLFRWMKTKRQWDLFEDKLQFGTGYHSRGGGCEEAFLFRRGKGLPVLCHGIRKEFYSPRREHSRKPDEVPGWIVDLYGDFPRLEAFARTPRPGWDVWGKEVLKFAGGT